MVLGMGLKARSEATSPGVPSDYVLGIRIWGVAEFFAEADFLREIGHRRHSILSIYNTKVETVRSSEG